MESHNYLELSSFYCQKKTGPVTSTLAMGRPLNSAKTVAVTISTTKEIRALLEVLVKDGTYGKNAAEAANLLIGEKLRELRKGDDILAEQLNQVQRKLYEERNKRDKVSIYKEHGST